MDSLFGGEMTGPARFIIAFVVVLALIAISAWLVRRFGSGSFSSSAARGRQPRLAVIDAASVDARRRLILVRRDNIEHLVMIGGPTDIVIEQNIVRATAVAPRDISTGPRPASIPDAMPRAVSLDHSAMWPLQPEPEPSVRGARAVEPQLQWPVASHQAPEASAPQAPQHVRPETAADLDDAVAAPPAPPPPKPVRAPDPEHVPHPEPQPARQYATPATDQNLAAMAQRLESALRRAPGGESRLDIPVTDAPSAGQPAPAETPDPHPGQGQAEGQGVPRGAQSKKFYETLEQEMASLLGRSGKT